MYFGRFYGIFKEKLTRRPLDNLNVSQQLRHRFLYGFVTSYPQLQDVFSVRPLGNLRGKFIGF